ncbi:hypothetical protein PG637_09455 [Riemerella anatipestifer]|nr:hypothetical protein [Riemerella anatipestifer]MDY3325890.1 hypothetical protein [Riemerella anatipestifer]MDY3352561.1 hypothetical protein [Riemerella anatipestifer]
MNQLLSSPAICTEYETKRLSLFIEKDVFYKKRVYPSPMALPAARVGLSTFTPRYSHTKSHLCVCEVVAPIPYALTRSIYSA